MGFLGAMIQHVRFEVSGLDKAPATLVARKRSLACVNPFVLAEISGRVETLRTFVARVGSFTSVQSGMKFEMFGSAVALDTLIASMRLLLEMNPHMT